MVQIVRVLMGVIKDRHGTYYARKTVPAKPAGLRAAVALELDNGKPAQSHLKRSLGTKDVRDANVRGQAGTGGVWPSRTDSPVTLLRLPRGLRAASGSDSLH